MCTATGARSHTTPVSPSSTSTLNPYGFSWWRRVTHENIDLNSNFQDFTQPLPRNTAYDEIAHLLVPPTWPARWRDNAALLGFLLRRGVRALQAAVSVGQYAHADGLFYGGNEPTWSHLALRRVLREHGRACEEVWKVLSGTDRFSSDGEATELTPRPTLAASFLDRRNRCSTCDPSANTARRPCPRRPPTP